MPYIAEDRRRVLTAGGQAENVGELTYLLTRAVLDYELFEHQFRVEIDEYLYVDREGEPRFKDYAEVLGALAATLLEYERRQLQTSFVKDGDGARDHTPADLDLGQTSILLRINRFLYEWYAEVVAPYEDLKRAEHGDVYPEES